MHVRHLAWLTAVAVIPRLAFGCAGESPRALASGVESFRARPLRAAQDPTVRGSRLFPQWLEDGRIWGVGPGGGSRVIIEGVRVLSSPNGAIAAAVDRLPTGTSIALPLPRRMGGGFLFASGRQVWHADAWIAPVVPLFTAPAVITQVFVGLDRIYARSPQGNLVAFDRTGTPAPLGPLPPSPRIGRLAALDAWNAVAIADLTGAVATRDAGATWQRLAPPFQPNEVATLDDSLAIGGNVESEPGRTDWFEVRKDGQLSRLSSAPPTDERPEQGTPRTDATTRPFGPVPLAVAIEDGWPLVDGTVLLARDGELARVRLADGAIVERVPHAFPLEPARCHPMSRARATDLGGLAFVCGEPRGRTVVYDWDASSARLSELRRFDGPREVLAFGNGALAARGSCAPSGSGETASGRQAWCTMSGDGIWTETTLRGDDVGRARIVVLGDGRLAVVRPPSGDNLATARLMLMRSTEAAEVAIAFPTVREDAAEALRLGLWMDGFEERRPGVLGGWVDTAGSVLGIEIALDGTARAGEYIRDAGAPVASGRWAFGWTKSRRGFETTDGGMTWDKRIDLPEPISSARGLRERACGPVGCIAAGWLRVGWGPAQGSAPVEPRAANPPPTPSPPPPTLTLECEAAGAARNAPAAAPEHPIARPGSMPPRARGRGTGTAPALTAPAWGTVSSFSDFSGRIGPVIPAGDLGVNVEAALAFERTVRNVPLARLYAWGPDTGDWDSLGRWQVRWQWPWGRGPEVRSSATAAVPWSTLDGARRALGVGPGLPAVWSLVPGDDPDHSLLVARHTAGIRTAEVFVLETGRTPAEVRGPGGDALPELEAALRVGTRWYAATVQAQGETPATVLWLLDGTSARELVRVPRLGSETRAALRLARRADARAIGLLVDGDGDRRRTNVSSAEMVPTRWVAALDLESRVVGDPQPLSPLDFSDRNVGPCSGDDSSDDDGWELDAPYPGAVLLHVGPRITFALQSVLARQRVSPGRVCIERLLGTADPYASATRGALGRRGQADALAASGGAAGGPAARGIEAIVLSAKTRYALRCTVR